MIAHAPSPSADQAPPRAVARAAQRLLAGAENSPSEADLIRRLLTDPRMQGVWRELGRQKPARGRTRDKALARFFHCAYFFAEFGIDTETLGAGGPSPAPEGGHSERLRTQAADLRSRFAPIPGAEEHAQAIERAAAFYDEWIKRMAGGEDLQLAEGDAGQRRAREYARSLAVEVRNLFGTWMPGPVAVTASVALAQGVTTQMVRDWCASLGGG
jgi:hypothetical protein